MGYTPFKMKGPSLYRTPVKDDEQAKARENVKAMDKESDKLKTNLSKHAKKQSIPTVTPDEKKVDNKKTNTKKVNVKKTKLMKTVENTADDKRRRERIAEIDMMKEWWSKKDERKKKTDERDRKEKEKREREKKQEDSWRNFGKPDWMN